MAPFPGSGLLAWFEGLPDAAVYGALGVGAALENVVPAIPADTFVVLGGFLTAVGGLQARWVFLATWLCNVASALLMVWVGRAHGPGFFHSRWGRRALNAHQMERVAVFFGRWGTPAIFFTRFLPGVRAVVPVFAGVTHQPWRSVVPPLATASAIWYGALVWAGSTAGKNVDRILAMVGQLNVWLMGAALALVGAAFIWWWRTRHHG